MDATQQRQPLAATRRRVLDELRERILTGRLKPGDRLVERELAEDLGVSRVPVREAIRSLEAEGFVVVPSPRRVVVRQLARTDVEELFDVREALESLAAARAAERAGKPEMRRLERLLAESARVTKGGDGARISEVNSRLHDEIIAIAGNRLLTTMLHPLEGQLRWLTSQNEHWDELLEEHRRLVEAIGSGEVERAREYAAEHVRVNREVTLRDLFGDDEQDERPAG
ncbi:GntR family transcriptional regulator [Amycolatopsis echigonensis]|uniref:GntR family transcriptional regulator n=1 Tax=Amycolatopsis echigonensis TaxID=2576905 RepID=A0A2N3WRU3_9PSEU|nr:MULTISPECIES: GntR family transcriptional regulator [Amycolatopsis]MBB2501553.1 GntR family transcriptional regulator [Amycolatopsis echigonensis]PKV96555.1 DNA-binding GntR family transcriptional regulator [Amycolatopsis niigatensis]